MLLTRTRMKAKCVRFGQYVTVGKILVQKRFSCTTKNKILKIESSCDIYSY